MTVARRALWLAQLFRPQVSHVVAFRVTLVGPLDTRRLIRSTRDVLDHIGWHDVHIPPELSPADPDCAQPLRPAGSGRAVVELVDLSGEPDPVTAGALRADEFIDALDGADLTTPLWRSELHTIHPQLHHWVVRVHHVLTDGAGAWRVMGHIADVYGGTACAGDLRVPSDADIDRADARYQQSDRHDTDASYWADTLAHHESSFLAGAPTVPTSAITRVTRQVMGERSPTSTETVAAFATFCARILDTPDVGLSLPVAARTSGVRKRTVAPLSNVIPLSLNGIGDRPVREAVTQVATSVVGSLRHQLFRREEMMRAREDITDFGAVVNLLPAVSRPTVDGVQWQIEVLRTGPVGDVAVTLHPADHDGLRAITWEAPSERVDPDRLATLAARFDGHLAATLDEIDGHEPVSDRSIFLPGEWDRFRCRSGPPAPPFVPTAGMLEHLRAHRPAEPAILDGDVVLTRGELVAAADRGARALISEGVGPGDAVAVCIDRSATSVVAFWSVIRAGAVWVPVNDPFAPASRTREILARTNVRVGLCAPGRPGPPPVRWVELDITGIDESTSDTTDEPAWQPPGIDRGADDRAYLLFTSGSTGQPKGVDMPHRGIPALVAEIRRSYALTPESRMLHASAPTFDTGIVEMLSSVATGAALVVAPTTAHGGDALAAVIDERDVTHIIVTPSVLDTLPVGVADRLQHVVLGGEAIPARLVATWGDRVRMRNAYGPTETRCSINFSGELVPGRPVTVGPPMVGVTEAILDRRGRPQPPGALGTLHCSGPQVADGYLDDPEQTAAVFEACTFADDPVMYRTGDLATWTDDGEVHILGRRDHQVKLRGLRIELGEIDAALSMADAVRHSATVLRELPSGRKALISFVVPESPGTSPDAGDLRSHLARSLPTYMIPSWIVSLDELPRTGNGKLDRRALDAHHLPEQPALRRPREVREELVLEAVVDAVGVTSIDLDRSFLDNGGDSLAVIRAARVLAAAGYPEVTANDLLTAPALAEVAARMSDTPRQPSRPSPSPSERQCERSLSAAERTVSREPGDRAAQLIRIAWVPESAAAAEPADVRSAVQTLLDRHPLLRSSFPDTADGPVVHTESHISVDAVLSVTESPATPGRTDLELIAAELSVKLDVRTAPPVAVAMVTGPAGTVTAVVIVAHHIAVDGQSLAIVAAEATALMQGRRLPPAPTGPWHCPTESSGDPRHADIVSAAPDAAWTLAGITPAHLPIAAAVRARTVIGVRFYERFLEDAAARGMTPFEAFRGVVAAALADVTSDRHIMSATPISRRPAGSEDVVGDFVLSALIPLDADADHRCATEVARACIDATTQPMEDVLCALGRPAVDGHLFAVPLLIGWTPAIDTAAYPGRLHVFPPSHTRWLLQVEGSPTRDGGLVVRMTGSAEAFGHCEIDAVSTRIVQRVESM